VASRQPSLQSPRRAQQPTLRTPLLIRGDCIEGAKDHLADDSVDLIICDPPFGIGEGKFGRQYSRRSAKILPGYAEAPPDYGAWTLRWLEQARRVLKPNGSMYVFSGHTRLIDILNAAAALELNLINQIIWQYQFGVATKRKFVTSHYNILYYSKSPKARPTFNLDCRFDQNARDERGRSLRYADMEDVWRVRREYQPGKVRNINKLPEALIEKIIAYSSNEGEAVCDFFLGNFATAVVATRMRRRIVGFEINPIAYAHHAQRFLPTRRNS
jgi:site-specific DNA-methyltransferase (adenine-specific)